MYKRSVSLKIVSMLFDFISNSMGYDITRLSEFEETFYNGQYIRMLFELLI